MNHGISSCDFYICTWLRHCNIKFNKLLLEKEKPSNKRKEGSCVFVNDVLQKGKKKYQNISATVTIGIKAEKTIIAKSVYSLHKKAIR